MPLPHLKQAEARCYPPGSVYRGKDSSCYYCERNATIYCEVHGSRLCGDCDCTYIHCNQCGTGCKAFPGLVDPTPAPKRGLFYWLTFFATLAIIADLALRWL